MKIDHKTFYKAGILCFCAIGVFNIFSLINTLTTRDPFSVVSSMFMIIFNFVVAGFFYYLYDNYQEPFSDFEQFNDIDKKEVTNEKEHNSKTA